MTGEGERGGEEGGEESKSVSGEDYYFINISLFEVAQRESERECVGEVGTAWKKKGKGDISIWSDRVPAGHEVQTGFLTGENHLQT